MDFEFSSSNSGLVLPLWPDGVPDTLTWDLPEEDTTLPNGLLAVRNVSRPTLSVFLPVPSLATGMGVVICPGGGFHFLAYDHEGFQVARWLNARGIAAFILKYRVTPTGKDFPASIFENIVDRQKMEAIEKQIHPLAAADGLQAVRMVREHAEEWKLSSDRIGIMGFSAGGVVTNMVATQYTLDSRPDFAAPIYSAWPPDATIPEDAPPLFLLAAADDATVPPSISIDIYQRWRAAGHSAELHIYAAGGHGFGMNSLGLPVDSWIERFGDWLDAFDAKKTANK